MNRSTVAAQSTRSRSSASPVRSAKGGQPSKPRTTAPSLSPAHRPRARDHLSREIDCRGRQRERARSARGPEPPAGGRLRATLLRRSTPESWYIYRRTGRTTAALPNSPDEARPDPPENRARSYRNPSLARTGKVLPGTINERHTRCGTPAAPANPTHPASTAPTGNGPAKSPTKPSPAASATEQASTTNAGSKTTAASANSSPASKQIGIERLEAEQPTAPKTRPTRGHNTHKP